MKLLSLAGTIVLLTATVYAQEEERRAKPPTGSYPPPGAATYDYVVSELVREGAMDRIDEHLDRGRRNGGSDARRAIVRGSQKLGSRG